MWRWQTAYSRCEASLYRKAREAFVAFSVGIADGRPVFIRRGELAPSCPVGFVHNDAGPVALKEAVQRFRTVHHSP